MGQKLSMVQRSKRVSLRRFMNWQHLANSQAPDPSGDDGQYLEFGFPRDILKYVIKLLDSQEYLVATQMSPKGVSQAKSFISAAESVLEQIDLRKYY